MTEIYSPLPIRATPEGDAIRTLLSEVLVNLKSLEDKCANQALRISHLEAKWGERG